VIARGASELSFSAPSSRFRALLRSLLVSALALALALSPARAASEEEPVVKSVVVEGNRRVEVDAIKAVMTTKPGQPVDRKKLQADVRALMKLGYFSDVVIEQRGPPGELTLVVRVIEKPTVQSTRIEGNEELSTDDLKDLVEVKASSILDVVQIRKTVKKMQEKYVEKGFFLAEVSYRIEEKPDNQVVVVFVVNEHAKVQVRRIDFVGNLHVPKDDLLAYMQTQEGSLLSFLTQAGTFKEEALDRDLQAVQALYLERGYVNVKVGRPSVSLSPDKKYLFISIPVEEGEQYTIGKIDFSGDLLDMGGVLRGLVVSRPGDLFQRSKVFQDLTAVGDLYRDQGYAYVNVTPLTNLDPKNRTLQLTFDVQPGKKIYLERIEIAGNSKTRDKVIRRELRIYEGALSSANGIKVSRQRVTALGYFESVEVTTKKGSADDRMVVTVEVKEKPTGTFQVGAGFSSYEKFILTGQVSQNNFLGWGQTLTLQLQWSSVRQLGQLQFVEPYFFDTKWTFAFDLYATDAYYINFNRRAAGGSLTWGYELSGLAWLLPFTRVLEDLRVFLTYTGEYVQVRPATVDLLLYNRFRSGATSAFRLSLQWDKRNNRLTPTSGYYISIASEWAPPFLAPEAIFGSSVNLFSRQTVDLRVYVPIIGALVWRARLNAGFIRPWSGAAPVPVSELYYLGGINTIRGYRLYTISPVTLVGGLPTPDSKLRFLAVGGNKMVVLNLELEYPILEKLGLRAVVFFDMGNSFAPGAWSDPNVGASLYKSWGVGFRWNSPLGPLRFEWGFPLNRRKDPFTGAYIDPAVDFQFTIGSFF